LSEMKLLHIYAQEIWHGEAYIVGNRDGLLALKEAIEQALVDSKSQVDEYASDGEGYKVRVIMNDTGWLEPFWDTLALPYSEKMTREGTRSAVWPWELWSIKEE